MLIDFAPSRQSSVGIEWELALVDLGTGELSPSAELILDAVGATDETPIRTEFLKNMVELVFGVHGRVADAVADLDDQLRIVRTELAPRNLGIIGAGTQFRVKLLPARPGSLNLTRHTLRADELQLPANRPHLMSPSAVFATTEGDQLGVVGFVPRPVQAARVVHRFVGDIDRKAYRHPATTGESPCQPWGQSHRGAFAGSGSS